MADGDDSEQQAIQDLRSKISKQLGLQEVDATWMPYIQSAYEFCYRQIRQLADVVGGGQVGPGPGSIIQSAALQLAMSRKLAEDGIRENDVVKLKLASQMANDSKANVLAAHELCVRESKGQKEKWRPIDDEGLNASGQAVQPKKDPEGYLSWGERERRARGERKKQLREAREQREQAKRETIDTTFSEPADASSADSSGNDGGGLLE